MEVINAICVPPTIEDVVEYTLNAITANYIRADINSEIAFQVRSDVLSALKIFLSGFDINVDVSIDNVGCLYDVTINLFSDGEIDTEDDIRKCQVYKTRHIVEWAEQL